MSLISDLSSFSSISFYTIEGKDFVVKKKKKKHSNGNLGPKQKVNRGQTNQFGFLFLKL